MPQVSRWLSCPLLAAACLLSACCSQQADTSTFAQLPQEQAATESWQDFATHSPVKDAQEALARGDYRLLAYVGRGGMTVPGLEPGDARMAEWQLRVVEGMSDALSKGDDASAYTRFVNYAAAYNHQVLSQAPGQAAPGS